jgi:hypothetical protein
MKLEDVKKIMCILGGLVLLIITCIIIMCEMDKKEMEKAYSEGRFEKCYTKDGDTYYK